MTICGEQALRAGHGDTTLAATLRCNAWTCEECRPRRTARLKAEARKGNPTTFLTLTSRISSEKTPDEAARELVRAWREIRRRASLLGERRPVEFLAVFERTKKGWPHLHVLARLPFLPQKLLSKWMEELTGSPIVDIRRVDSAKGAARYVAKYLAKGPEAFNGCKRYWRSLNYLSEEDRPSACKLKVDGEIWISKFSYAFWLLNQKRHGRALYRSGNWTASRPSGCGPPEIETPRPWTRFEEQEEKRAEQ